MKSFKQLLGAWLAAATNPTITSCRPGRGHGQIKVIEISVTVRGQRAISICLWSNSVVGLPFTGQHFLLERCEPVSTQRVGFWLSG